MYLCLHDYCLALASQVITMHASPCDLVHIYTVFLSLHSFLSL